MGVLGGMLGDAGLGENLGFGRVQAWRINVLAWDAWRIVILLLLFLSKKKGIYIDMCISAQYSSRD